MQFSGKAPTFGSNNNPNRREAKDLAIRAARVDAALAHDPAFQVRTVDGSQWICPYSGLLIPLIDGNLEPARRYLMERQPWTGRGRHRPAVQVLTQKWSLHLTAIAGSDPRFAQFNAQGHWRNPHTGQWLALPHPHTALTGPAIKEIALLLASGPQPAATLPD